jgi:hypothetical protein
MDTMDYFMVDHYTFQDISAFDKGTLIMGNTPQPPSHDLGKNFKTTIDKAYRPKVFHVHCFLNLRDEG